MKALMSRANPPNKRHFLQAIRDARQKHDILETHLPLAMKMWQAMIDADQKRWESNITVATLSLSLPTLKENLAIVNSDEANEIQFLAFVHATKEWVRSMEGKQKDEVHRELESLFTLCSGDDAQYSQGFVACRKVLDVAEHVKVFLDPKGHGKAAVNAAHEASLAGVSRPVLLRTVT